MTPKPKAKPIYVDFVCLACSHGYRTQLPRPLVKPAKKAWSRVHWGDDGCQVAVRELETA